MFCAGRPRRQGGNKEGYGRRLTLTRRCRPIRGRPVPWKWKALLLGKKRRGKKGKAGMRGNVCLRYSSYLRGGKGDEGETLRGKGKSDAVVRSSDSRGGCYTGTSGKAEMLASKEKKKSEQDRLRHCRLESTKSASPGEPYATVRAGNFASAAWRRCRSSSR